MRNEKVNKPQNQQLNKTAVMPCALISKDYFKMAHENSIKQLKPIKEEFKIVTKKFEEEMAEIKNGFLEILEKYYDQILFDKNGTTIKAGNTITDGKDFYLVVDRGMQIIFGEFLFNTRIVCVKWLKNDKQTTKKYSFFPRELTDFVVHKA